MKINESSHVDINSSANEIFNELMYLAKPISRRYKFNTETAWTTRDVEQELQIKLFLCIERFKKDFKGQDKSLKDIRNYCISCLNRFMIDIMRKFKASIDKNKCEDIQDFEYGIETSDSSMPSISLFHIGNRDLTRLFKGSKQDRLAIKLFISGYTIIEIKKLVSIDRMGDITKKLSKTEKRFLRKYINGEIKGNLYTPTYLKIMGRFDKKYQKALVMFYSRNIKMNSADIEKSLNIKVRMVIKSFLEKAEDLKQEAYATKSDLILRRKVTTV